jgi:hypothetical protein
LPRTVDPTEGEPDARGGHGSGIVARVNRRRAIGLLAILPLGVLALGCEHQRRHVVRLAHENGLVLRYDDRVEGIVPTREGYTLSLTPTDARAINRIGVRLQAGPVPGADAWDERTVGGRRFRFHVQREAGGSGGDEYTATIATPIGPRWLVAEHHVQSENEPDFDVAWDLIRTAEVR